MELVGLSYPLLYLLNCNVRVIVEVTTGLSRLTSERQLFLLTNAETLDTLISC